MKGQSRTYIEIQEVKKRVNKELEKYTAFHRKNPNTITEVAYRETKDLIRPQATNELWCCGAKNGEEIDGEEFQVETLQEFVEELKHRKEIHINYFSGEDDMDLWIKVE